MLFELKTCSGDIIRTLIDCDKDDTHISMKKRLAFGEYVSRFNDLIPPVPLDLSYGYFRGYDFSNMNLRGMNFSHADLTDAIFFNTEICDAKFNGAILRGVTFKHVNVYKNCNPIMDLNNFLDAVVDDDFIANILAHMCRFQISTEMKNKILDIINKEG